MEDDFCMEDDLWQQNWWCPCFPGEKWGYFEKRIGSLAFPEEKLVFLVNGRRLLDGRRPQTTKLTIPMSSWWKMRMFIKKNCVSISSMSWDIKIPVVRSVKYMKYGRRRERPVFIIRNCRCSTCDFWEARGGSSFKDFLLKLFVVNLKVKTLRNTEKQVTKQSGTYPNKYKLIWYEIAIFNQNVQFKKKLKKCKCKQKILST